MSNTANSTAPLIEWSNRPISLEALLQKNYDFRDQGELIIILATNWDLRFEIASWLLANLSFIILVSDDWTVKDWILDEAGINEDEVVLPLGPSEITDLFFEDFEDAYIAYNDLILQKL